MIRNLKMLGLALLATFALGAIGAQVVSAADSHEFKAEVQKVVLTGAQVGSHQFTIGSVGTVECATATFESTTDAGPGVTEVDELTPGRTTVDVNSAVRWRLCSSTTAPSSSIRHSIGQPDRRKTRGRVARVCPRKRDQSAHGELHDHDRSSDRRSSGQLCARRKRRKVVPNAVNVTATAHGIVVGKERNTASQPVNGCLIFPTGAVGKYTGLTTVECRQDEGSAQANPTTPTGTQDAASTNCEVTNL